LAKRRIIVTLSVFKEDEMKRIIFLSVLVVVVFGFAYTSYAERLEIGVIGPLESAYRTTGKTAVSINIIVLGATTGTLIIGLTQSSFTMVDARAIGSFSNISPSFSFSVIARGNGIYTLTITPVATSWSIGNSFLFLIKNGTNNGFFECDFTDLIS
jgi:hypothetical protein